MLDSLITNDGVIDLAITGNSIANAAGLVFSVDMADSTIINNGVINVVNDSPNANFLAGTFAPETPNLIVINAGDISIQDNTSTAPAAGAAFFFDENLYVY